MKTKKQSRRKAVYQSARAEGKNPVRAGWVAVWSGKTAKARAIDTTKDLARIAMFIALIIVGAFLRIPLGPVSFSMQMTFMILAAMMLGSKRALLAVLIYIAMGLAGLPIFSTGGGIAYVVTPLFGYLIGFVVASVVTGRIAEHGPQTYKRLFTASFLGMAIVYLFGMVYAYLIYIYYLRSPVAASTILVGYFLAVLPGNTVMNVLAVMLAKRLNPVLKMNPALFGKKTAVSAKSEDVEAVVVQTEPRIQDPVSLGQEGTGKLLDENSNE